MPRRSPTGPVSSRRRPVAAAYGAKGAPPLLRSRPGLAPSAARGGAKRQVGGLTWAGRQAGLREIERLRRQGSRDRGVFPNGVFRR